MTIQQSNNSNLNHQRIDGKLHVDLGQLEQVIAYLRELNSVPTEDVVWIDKHGDRIYFDPALISEWKFLGLNNKDFAVMHGLVHDPFSADMVASFKNYQVSPLQKRG